MEIRSQDITQTLGGCEILKGVSIDVQSKKFIGIIGSEVPVPDSPPHRRRHLF